MKKSVVLLITLLFIMSISALLLKNFDTTDKLMKNISLNSQLTQLKITHKNIQDEVTSFFYKNKDDKEVLKKIIEITSLGFPFNVGELNIFLTIDYFIDESICNINDIKTQEKLYESCDESITQNILYPYDFIYKLNQYQLKYKKIDTKAKLEYFLNDYKSDTKDTKIKDIYDSFSLVTLSEANNTDIDIYNVNYDFTTNDLNVSGNFLFDINTKKIINNSIIFR